MGRYFAVQNTTTKQKVREGSQCWKSDYWCDLFAVMHKYGWKKNENISTSCYDSVYQFNPETEEMDELSLSELMEESVPVTQEEYETLMKVWKTYDFSFTDEMERCQVENHCPIWENDQCTHCGFKID